MVSSCFTDELKILIFVAAWCLFLASCTFSFMLVWWYMMILTSGCLKSWLVVCCLQAFRKDDRVVLDRKALFKNTLRKAAYAWKRIIELRLSGLSVFYSVVHSCNWYLVIVIWIKKKKSCYCHKWEVSVCCYRRGSCYAQILCGPTCFYGSTLGTIQSIVLMAFFSLIYYL